MPDGRDAGWEKAQNLFARKLWNDAEKTYLEVAHRETTSELGMKALIKAGECQLRLRDYSAAQRHFNRILRDTGARRRAPDILALAYRHSYLILRAQKRSQATRMRLMQDFGRALPQHKEYFKLIEQEAGIRLKEQQYREAFKLYQQAGTERSPSANRIVALLDNSLQMSPPPLSDKEIRAVIELAKTDPEAALATTFLLEKRREGWRAAGTRAVLLHQQGKYKDAIAVYDALLQSRQGPVDRLSLERAAIVAAGKAAAGVDAYQEWLKKHATSTFYERAVSEHVALLLQVGRHKESLELGRKFLEERRQSRYAPHIAGTLKRAEQAQTRKEAGQEARAAAARKAAQNPQAAKLAQARSFFQLQRYADAKRIYLGFKDQRRDPLWSEAWFGLEQSLQALGDTKEALEVWDDIWRRGQVDQSVKTAAAARWAAGDALLEDLADPQRALRYYTEAAAKNPAGNAVHERNHGLALLATGHPAEAKGIFERLRAAAAKDPIALQNWDNLIKMCQPGARPNVLPHMSDNLTPAMRRAGAEIMLADGYFAGGTLHKALRLYRRAAGRSPGDYVDLQIARCYAALDKRATALKYYARFKDEHRRSPLAAAALLYAGTLTAAPPNGSFRQAREWFALTVRNHAGTPEARAAEFYTATLAWRARKWSEAAQLHKAFAAKHPDSPLARVALEERLPAIAKKSLAVPLHAAGHDPIVVYVGPGDRKRRAIPIEQAVAFNVHLDIKPKPGYQLVRSGIVDQHSRGVGALWEGPDPATAQLHRYHLCDAYSSQEYVIIDGTIDKPRAGVGGKGDPPPFRVTVPSVDIDWVGFSQPTDEIAEEERFIIVPLNTNTLADIRTVIVNDPFDDDERHGRPTFPYGRPVDPVISLHWEAGGSLDLLDGKKLFGNGNTINARKSTWPRNFTVEPLIADLAIKLYAKGQIDDYGTKAIDNIHGRIVNVDLDVDANYDGQIDDDDEPLEEDPGGLVCVGTNNLTRIELKVEPTGLQGKITLDITMGADKIRLWRDPARTTPEALTNSWTVATMPKVLYIEGITNSTTARDVALILTYDENPPGQNNPLFKASDKIRLAVIKVEIEYPYDTDGNGKIDDPDNEFSFDTSSPALLQIPCQAFYSLKSDPDMFRWKIEDVGAIKGVWDPHVDGDVYTGKGLSPTVTFTGMPEHNADFGRKKITLNYEGLSCFDEEYVEAFFDPKARNNPGPPGEAPPGTITMEDLIE